VSTGRVGTGRRSVLRAAGLAALAGVGGSLAAGCTSDDGQAGSPVNGDPGTADLLKTYPAADRKPGPALRGTLIDGRSFDLSSWQGRPVVVNVWGSWCGPCKDEQPALVAAAAQLAPQGVQFLGLDQQDSRANALAHVRKYGVGYPSISDPAGAQLLRFNGLIPPAGIPSTVVLDAQHRIGAIRIGTITQATLVDLVRTVIA